MVSHIGTAVAVLVLWVIFMSTDSAGWAWAAFGVPNVNNGLGDAILPVASDASLRLGPPGGVTTGVQWSPSSEVVAHLPQPSTHWPAE